MTRPPPQTEEEERLNLVRELAWLTGEALRIDGRLPRVIREPVEAGGLNLNEMSAPRIAELCAGVLAEYPEFAGRIPKRLF